MRTEAYFPVQNTDLLASVYSKHVEFLLLVATGERLTIGGKSVGINIGLRNIHPAEFLARGNVTHSDGPIAAPASQSPPIG